ARRYDGPALPAWAVRERTPPNRVRVGGGWVNYLPIPGVGLTLKMTTAALDALDARPGKADDPAVQDAVLRAFEGIGQAVADESLMQGFSQLWDAAHSPAAATRYLETLARGLVPGSAGLNRVARATDPTVRAACDPLEYLEAGIPGLSENLPPKLDDQGASDRARRACRTS